MYIAHRTNRSLAIICDAIIFVIFFSVTEVLYRDMRKGQYKMMILGEVLPQKTLYL